MFAIKMNTARKIEVSIFGVLVVLLLFVGVYMPTWLRIVVMMVAAVVALFFFFGEEIVGKNSGLPPTPPSTGTPAATTAAPTPPGTVTPPPVPPAPPTVPTKNTWWDKVVSFVVMTKVLFYIGLLLCLATCVGYFFYKQGENNIPKWEWTSWPFFIGMMALMVLAVYFFVIKKKVTTVVTAPPLPPTPAGAAGTATVAAVAPLPPAGAAALRKTKSNTSWVGTVVWLLILTGIVAIGYYYVWPNHESISAWAKNHSGTEVKAATEDIVFYAEKFGTPWEKQTPIRMRPGYRISFGSNRPIWMQKTREDGIVESPVRLYPNVSKDLGDDIFELRFSSEDNGVALIKYNFVPR